MMYDEREKAQRDYLAALEGARLEGLEEGLEKGREEGVLVGKIQVLRQLLDEEAGSEDDLRNRSVEELSSLLDELQQRLRTRGE